MAASWARATSISPPAEFPQRVGILLRLKRWDKKKSFLSVASPILVAAATAYAIQEILKRVREQQTQRNIAVVARLGSDLQGIG